jgi:hypothetical protein
MSAKNITPKTVAENADKKKAEETAPMPESVEIPHQTAAEPDVTEPVEEPKVSVIQKAAALVKKHRRHIALGVSVGLIFIGVQTAKKRKPEAVETVDEPTDEPETIVESTEA